ncbi:UDP-glycosyltransferase 76E2 [Morus notabilis]|uniref:UDP-glycosyltransferase 76E2 n=1 Tax=Morus notabilis TaxID=981085 RepID=W9QEH6_9ROSA|nr:UDP-glucose iridoid glucosyltransferase [Morus notabilis]EXB30475.1 UDP-glycosyltransferase 76E2 [Morus notabilis]
MGEQAQKTLRLVLVPFPYQGHISPMLQLGAALHSKGFSITIAHTICNSPNSQNHPNFSFLRLSDGLSDTDIESRGLAANLLAINDNCKESFQWSLEQLIMEDRKTISCVISDELMYFAEDVANNLKILSIILRTTSAITSLARSFLLKLVEGGHVPLQGFASDELVARLPLLRFKDLPCPLTENFKSFAVIVARAYNKRTCSAIIWNTINCLEQSTLDQIQKESQVRIFAIGPMHKITPSISSSLIKEDRSCISWLDKQPHNSVVYVSISGSIASLYEKEVTEMAWGLANSKQAFLWAIRPGSIRGSDWIELLPNGFQDAVGDKGCIVSWAPQKEVLAHPAVGGFWSHCGWNSTLESLAQGVPMICKPCFGDQRVNARYASHVWKVGLELEEVERGEIARVVRRLILCEEGKEIRARAKKLKQKIDVSTRKGGSSYDSLNQLANFILSL